MPRRRTLGLSEEQRQQLSQHRDHDPRPYVRERCAALLKVADGQSPHAVALHGLLKPRQPDTVYQWLGRYQAEGLPGLLAYPHGGYRRGVLDRKQQLVEELRQGPSQEGPQPATTHAEAPPLSRWTLEAIRAHFAWLTDYSLSGVWRLLHRHDLKLRSARVQQYSPDPDYASKVADLEMCLWEARRYPGSVVAVFLDEFSYRRWPDPAPDWADAAPLADRQQTKDQQWRTIGALNAWTGQVDYLDAYVVGRAKVIEFYGRLVEAYPEARQLYVIQDNWSIHKHPDVLEALRQWPQVEPIWLPTYAPWLNPIEKLWRWLRQDVLKLHRLANSWPQLRGQVHAFLNQFAQGSTRLLEYVGLLGSGQLAQMILGP
jgi:transposase